MKRAKFERRRHSEVNGSEAKDEFCSDYVNKGIGRDEGLGCRHEGDLANTGQIWPAHGSY